PTATVCDRRWIFARRSPGGDRPPLQKPTRRRCQWPRPGNLPSPLCRAFLPQAIRVACTRRNARHHHCDGRSRARSHGKDRSRRTFVLELVIYASLVTGYFFAVLHFRGGWFVQLETQHIRVYAVVAILLIIGQAVVLEAVTTGLMRLLRGGRSE